MPKRIIAIGFIFVACGLLALREVLVALAENRISLNFMVLTLPIGIGLLFGKRSSQWWARFWIFLGYCFFGLFMVLAIATPQHIQLTWFGNQIRGVSGAPYLVIFAIASLVILVVMHRMLYSKKSSAYFNRVE